MQTLHILNGDSLASAMTEIGMEGEIAIWREALSLGPADSDIGSSRFMELRNAHIDSLYPDLSINYKDSFGKELDKMKSHLDLDEIVLWFGADYFCQINLMACLAFLFQAGVNGEENHISLICVDEHEGTDILCLGALKAEELKRIYPSRKKLSHSALELANNLWNAYSTGNYKAFLEPIAENDPAYFRNMQQLFKSLFADKNTGLNRIQKSIINKIKSKDSISLRELLRALLIEDKNYGFGDLQYEFWIKSLLPLYANVGDKLELTQNLSLNEEGLEIINGNRNFSINRGEPYYLGGSFSKEYRAINDYSELERAGS